MSERELRSERAWIQESACIGCFRCVGVCQERAIVGAARQLHTVVRLLCTGCADCLAVCPVDCILLEPMTKSVGLVQP